MQLKQFLKTAVFSRAILVGVGVSVPIMLGILFDHFEIGLALCFGAFWCSSSDVSGSFKLKRNGILISALLVMVVTFIGGYLQYDAWLSLAILGLLSFAISLISVYGFRSSLISFSGLLALVLSFAHDVEELEIYQYAFLVGLGGVWYLLLARILYLLNPKADTEEFLIQTYNLTAQFITTRGKLVGSTENTEKLQAKLLNLQSQLTENHATLREILILSKKSSGWSNYQDKRLLVFAKLVEMMETAIANPVNYERMDALFKDHPQYIKLFKDLIFNMAHQLRMIAQAGNDKNKLPDNDKLLECFKCVNLEIESMREALSYEEYLMLQNFLDYQKKQFKKLKRIKWLLGNTTSEEIDFIDRKVAKRFVERQDYNPMLLIRSLSFKSTIFRHSLRLAVTVMIGFLLGSIFSFQNPYWILLTIVIIMRPNYGLTKTRAKDRMIGTLIGGAIAYGMVFLIQDVYVYGFLGLISLVIALALVQKNSKVSAVFVTLSVVFIYAILSTDVVAVIKFRILDTLVGAGLSYIAMLWLWPTWESVEIKESVEKSIKANKEFFHKITDFYEKKGLVPTSYNIARKEAFLETSNLNAAFQRMAQEPKSKQGEMDKNYELVVLNHTFLASLASLSTFIQHHTTSPASDQFKLTTQKIDNNLEFALQCLSDPNRDIGILLAENDSVYEGQLPRMKFLEANSLTPKDDQAMHDMQEAHLVWEQLQWLFSISRRMLELSVNKKLD